MRYKMIYILFLIFLLITIPYVITVFLSQQDKNIQFENYDSGYQVISGNDKDDLETYLLKILPGQISMDQENEAVKAQAVILRTDIIRRMENKKQIARQKLPYTTYENSEYRKKLGNRSYQSMDQKRKKSVSETRGKVITYKNKLIEPYFHALSVGMTLDSREWFGKDLPYIREKESLSDIEAKDYMSVKVMSYEKIAGMIKTKTKKDIKINRLEKNLYFEQYKGKLRIICLGKGNGLGMSQYGAGTMAKTGKSYKKILKYYYPKTMIQKLYE